MNSHFLIFFEKSAFESLAIYTTVLLTLFSACQSPSAPQNTPNSIERNPDYIVEDGNTKVGVYSYERFEKFFHANNDTTYIINFWATWCKPCVEELPHFEELYQHYKNEKVRLVLVSLDFEKELKTKLLPFIKEKNLQGEVVVLQQKGMDKWIDMVAPSWSGSIPATVIYKKDKRAFFEKMFTYKELEEALLSCKF